MIADPSQLDTTVSCVDDGTFGVVFQVNLSDDLAQRIFKITQEGLYWKTQYKKEPVAFGIYKLIIGVTVEDEKVSVDDLVEKIEAFDDAVQSVEIMAFNKI